MNAGLSAAAAVTAGLAVAVAGSVAVDALLFAVGAFPDPPLMMSDAQFAAAAAYRTLLAVAGGFVTAWCSRRRPWAHAAVLAAIGVLAGVGGLIAYGSMGQDSGPFWYALSLPLTAPPSVALGAWLCIRRRTGHGRAAA